LEGDLVYGRGSVDDKAGIVSIFLALKALQTMAVDLLGDVDVHLTNEEEVGWLEPSPLSGKVSGPMAF